MAYTVQAGDTLGKIAQKLLGDSNRYTEILKLNPQIKNANMIQVGQVLNVPPTSKTSLVPAVQSPQIPPTADSGFLSRLPASLKAVLTNKKMMLALGGLVLVAVALKYRTKKGVA